MQCPWCGRENLNVYGYCQGCGRGFAGPAAGGFQLSPHTENVSAWFSPPAGAPSAPAGFWPVVTAVTALGFGFAMIWESRGGDAPLATPVLGALAGLTVVAVVGWALAAFGRGKAVQPAKAANVLTQVVVVRFVEGTPDERAEAALGAAVERESALAGLTGFRQATSQLSGTAAGLLGITWHNGSSLPSPDEVKKAVQRALESVAGTGAVATVQAFEAQPLGAARPPRVRMSAMAGLGGIVALAVAGLAASAGFAAF